MLEMTQNSIKKWPLQLVAPSIPKILTCLFQLATLSQRNKHSPLDSAPNFAIFKACELAILPSSQGQSLVYIIIRQAQQQYQSISKHINNIKSYMSKAKGKDKKSDNNSAEAQLIEQQKRQILQHSFTIKRLQDRLSRMAEQNFEVTTNRDEIQQKYEERIDKQRIIIESHESNIKQNRTKIYELQVSKMTLENKIKDLQRQIKQQEAIKNRQFDDYRRITQNQMAKLEIQLKEYNIYMGEREQMSSQNSRLKKTVKQQQEDKIRQVADKQREKVQAIDRLRDQMLTKIKDMRSNLLSLKKEQLDTTTRLAVLQNHQLTSELEFQSKQSEKLIFENQQLLKKVAHLQKDLEIHKEIEEELAKRSHYSRGIIKKLTSKISELQQNLKENNQKSTLRNQQSAMKASQGQDLKKEQLIKVLDKNLENSEKKYLKLQSQTEINKSQLLSLRAKIQNYQRKANSIIQVLLRVYSQFQQNRLQARQGEYSIDLKSIRNKAVQQWSKDQLKLVANALLQQVATYLNRKTLGLPAPYKPEDVSVLDSDQTINNIKLPKISEHSTNTKLELSMKLKQLPISLGSKLVGSQVREWGRSVHSSSHTNLVRRYKVNDK